MLMNEQLISWEKEITEIQTKEKNYRNMALPMIAHEWILDILEKGEFVAAHKVLPDIN